MRELLGGQFLAYLAQNQPAPLLRRTAGGSPLESLVRIFLIGAPVDRRAAEIALAPLGLAEATAAGVVAVEDGSVSALIRLRPYEADGHLFVVASDAATSWPGGFDAARLPADHVIGVGASSATLAKMTIRDPVGRALDLGTGSGVQALHASVHAGEVIGTDVSPRAARFAGLSAELSGVANLTTRVGSLFAPVEGERFGLIVSNPPYAVSPDSRFVFRDSGLEGDEICRRLVQQAPAHLEEGGWCQLLANWVHPSGDDWKERLAGWFAGTGCDAWVIQRSAEGVEDYATGWVLQGESPGADPANQVEVIDRWLAYYARLGIGRIGAGLITLRRRSAGRPFVRFEELRHDPVRACGDDIRRSFALVDWLDSLNGDDGLLDSPLAVADDVRLHQELGAAGGRFEATTSELWRATGLGRKGLIDANAAGVVAACDGTSTLRARLGELAGELGTGTDAVVSAALPAVRLLVEQGFLVPPSLR